MEPDGEQTHENAVITKNTLVFGDVRRHWVSYCRHHFCETWIDIREELKDKLTGHRFSPHPYTLYSLRSTFIEDQLLKGTPVMEVAEMAGHDVRETQKTYARLNLRRKGSELTMPELGKRRIERTKVDLFDDETTNATTT
ncbi:site-specific integrase [Synechococcus sp. A15-127]|uniref:site-specific integrase n=1 Tax=Synechococcus sp. A15-127 TaxID=1050624 RepID=UPI0016496D06|nr:site-specific integrase [Synechococcus sp. A15-127]